MNKRIVCITLVVLFMLFGMAGVATSVCEEEPSPEVEGAGHPEFVDYGIVLELPDPDLLPPKPFDPSWQPFTGLDREFVSLTLGGPSIIVNVTLPSGVKGQLSWISLDNSVATVVANSPARITPVGVGKTWVVAVVKTDTRTYYDTCLVEVVAAQAASVGVTAAPATQPAATPSTAGGLNGALFGVLLITAAVPFLRRTRF